MKVVVLIFMISLEAGAAIIPKSSTPPMAHKKGELTYPEFEGKNEVTGFELFDIDIYNAKCCKLRLRTA